MLALLLLASIALRASAQDTVQYGAFLQTATYSVANQLGFFAANNLNVVYQQVPNSSIAYAGVLDGTYDVLTGTIDNAVNLRFNQQEELTVLGQLDQGSDLVVASRPDITEVCQLRGKSLIVDSPVSGFAYILQKVLSLHGLNIANGDYFFQTVGGTSLRYVDLVQGSLPNGSTVYATILTYPFTAEGSVLSALQRPNVLARVSDFIAPFSSSAFTVQQAALSDGTKTDILTRFLASFYAANQYLADLSHVNCSVDAIARQLNVSMDVAALEYEAAQNPVSGEISPGSNFTVDRQGLLNVIDVRSQFGGFSIVPAGFNYAEAIEPGPGKLLDYRVRDAAVALAQSSNFRPQVLGCT